MKGYHTRQIQGMSKYLRQYKNEEHWLHNTKTERRIVEGRKT